MLRRYFFLFSIILLSWAPGTNWCQNVTIEVSGDDYESGSGDIVIVSSGSDEDEVEGSGAVTVNHHVDYTMSGANGFNIRIALEDREDSDKLHLICSLEVGDDFQFGSCPPEMYLVEHSTCSGLPNTISAKKLGELDKAGEDDSLVDVEYSELSGKCMIVIRKTSCGGYLEDASGSGAGDINPDDEIARLINSEEDDEYLRANVDVFRSSSFGRTFTSISLSGFTVLSSGSTNAFTISIPSVVKPGGFSGSVVIPGVVHTNYDKFSTLPYLQLTGWTYNDALNLVGFIFLTILITQLPRLSPLLSLAPSMKRRFFDLLDYAESDQFSARMDALQDGLVDIVHKTRESVAYPWVDLLQSLGRKYFTGLNNQKKYHDYFAIRKIDEQYGNYEYVDEEDEDDYTSQSSYYQYDNVINGHKSPSEYQQTKMQDLKNLFPDFDKFMSFLK